MNSSHKNYIDYRQGKDRLENAVMQHPDGNDVYDYLKKNVERNFWVTPFKEWEKKQKLHNK